MRLKNLLLVAIFLALLLSLRLFSQRGWMERPPVRVQDEAARRNMNRVPTGVNRPRPVERAPAIRRDFEDGGPAPVVRKTIPGSVVFSPPPGRYPRPVDVTLSSKVEPGSIHYTLDFTDAESGGSLYREPLTIASNAVIRARAFSASGEPTRVVSATYLIGGVDGPEPLPTLSITLDPADYATVQTSPWLRGREAERPAFFEWIDAGGHRVAGTGFGIRLHGGAGRNGGMGVKKSYRAYFRKQYGDGKLHCPIIPDTEVKEFGKLVLRAGYNDRLRPGRGEYNTKAAYLRDQVIRDLHRDMGFVAAHGTWCLLYVNLDFWGLYNVVERLDEDFLAAYAGGKSWDVINTGEGVISGTSDEWMDLREFLGRADLTRDADYAEIGRRVDLQNFTDYIILNLWAQNFDWPHNNWYAARKKEAGARWMFLAWDVEWGMGLRPWGYQVEAAQVLLANQGGGLIRDLFRDLIANPKYRSYFLDEVHRHLQGALQPERVLARVHRQRDLVAPVMVREIDTFYQSGAHSQWLRNLQEVDQFAKFRGRVFEEQMRSFLLDPSEDPGTPFRR